MQHSACSASNSVHPFAVLSMHWFILLQLSLMLLLLNLAFIASSTAVFMSCRRIAPGT